MSLRTITLHILHTVHLGICQSFCQFVIWELLVADLFGMGGREEDRFANSVLRLRTSLFEWYGSLSQEEARETTRVQEFNIEMLGSKTHRALKTKGMETKGLLPWCLRLLDVHGHVLGEACRRPLKTSGEALMGWFHIVKTSPRNMTAAQMQAMCSAGVKHLVQARRAGVPFKPKHHLFTHLIRSCRTHGNPRDFSTFLDESCNRVLASVARSAYSTVWEQRTFAHFNELRQ